MSDNDLFNAKEFNYTLPPIADMWSLKVSRLDDEAWMPTRAHDGDLGLDLYALETTRIVPNTVTKVRTGIACGFPRGMGALIRDRSSVATKMMVFTVAGVIDNQYTGEIIVAFMNPFDQAAVFISGDKIAQLILTPVVTCPIIEVTELGQTARGANGFGSSGS